MGQKYSLKVFSYIVLSVSNGHFSGVLFFGAHFRKLDKITAKVSCSSEIVIF